MPTCVHAYTYINTLFYVISQNVDKIYMSVALRNFTCGRKRLLPISIYIHMTAGKRYWNTPCKTATGHLFIPEGYKNCHLCYLGFLEAFCQLLTYEHGSGILDQQDGREGWIIAGALADAGRPRCHTSECSSKARLCRVHAMSLCLDHIKSKIKSSFICSFPSRVCSFGAGDRWEQVNKLEIKPCSEIT